MKFREVLPWWVPVSSKLLFCCFPDHSEAQDGSGSWFSSKELPLQAPGDLPEPNCKSPQYLMSSAACKAEGGSSAAWDCRPVIPSPFLPLFVSGVCQDSAWLQAAVALVPGFSTNLAGSTRICNTPCQAGWTNPSLGHKAGNFLATRYMKIFCSCNNRRWKKPWDNYKLQFLTQIREKPQIDLNAKGFSMKPKRFVLMLGCSSK